MATDNDTLTVNLTLTAAPSAPRMSVILEKTATPSQLHAKVAEETKIPISSLKLIFRGRLIADDDSKEVVTEYKLEDGCVLHCMGKPAAGGQNTAATSGVAAAAAPTAAGSSVSFLPPTAPTAAAAAGGDSLQAALNTLRSSNSPSVYLTAVTTLEKILSNCVEKPMEEKYRIVKKGNAAFQKRIGGLQGGEAAMLASGFVLEGEGDQQSYVLHASPEAWPKLVATKTKVSAAVVEAKSAAGAASGPPPPAAAGFGGASIPPAMGAGMPGIGAGMPGMGAGGVPPNMQNAMSNLMSDPNALESMLQVRLCCLEDVYIRWHFSFSMTHSSLLLYRIQWCATWFRTTLGFQTIHKCNRVWMLWRPILKCSIKSAA